MLSLHEGDAETDVFVLGVRRQFERHRRQRHRDSAEGLSEGVRICCLFCFMSRLSGCLLLGFDPVSRSHLSLFASPFGHAARLSHLLNVLMPPLFPRRQEQPPTEETLVAGSPLPCPREALLSVSPFTKLWLSPSTRVRPSVSSNRRGPKGLPPQPGDGGLCLVGRKPPPHWGPLQGLFWGLLFVCCLFELFAVSPCGVSSSGPAGCNSQTNGAAPRPL